jgi:hypothetical protein
MTVAGTEGIVELKSARKAPSLTGLAREAGILATKNITE